MRTCPRCNKVVPGDAQFCQFCGADFGTPAAAGVSPGINLPEQVRTSDKAVASFICGILFFIFPAAIAAVVLGHLSVAEIGRSAGRIRGRGMAITGLVLGYLGLSIIPILIIAAIAIPNLLRARMAANEASAVGALRSYNYAMGAYAARCPQIGFPTSLANLGHGKSGGCDSAGLLDDSLGTDLPIKSGYAFHYQSPEADNLGQVTSFVITADPLGEGTTGMRHFSIDQNGVIRSSLNAPADASSPVLQ